MADSYSQVYIHVVIAVKGRENLISPKWEKELYKYIAGIIRNKGQKSIIIGGMPDHIHAFIGLKPSMAISDLVRDIKNNSSKFINDNGFVRGKFYWQEGYGVFSYSHSQVENVYNYILNQKEHHSGKTFKREYLEYLKEFEVDFDDKFLFEWYEE